MLGSDHGPTVDGVDRRWWGAIIVASVLLAAIVIPNVPGRRIAGSPSAGAVPGPPSTDDCVTWIADPWPRFDNPAPQIDDVFDYPTLTVGPCDGGIVGEVVSVADNPEPPVRISATDYLSQISQCPIDAIAYTGSIAPVVQTASGTSVVWAAQPQFRYTRVGPSRAQRAQGQQWSACLIGSVDGVPYSGRLHDVFTAGTLPAAFGTCLLSIDPSRMDQLSCDRPHPAELLATTSLGPRPTSGADVQQACVDFAGRALRTSDPTRAGAVRIQVVVLRDWGVEVVEPGPESLADTFAGCVAVAQNGAMLIRSLIGVADGPLPTG